MSGTSDHSPPGYSALNSPTKINSVSGTLRVIDVCKKVGTHFSSPRTTKTGGGGS